MPSPLRATMLACLLAAAALPLSPGRARACSCLPPPPPAEAAEAADEVFEGHVEAIEPGAGAADPKRVTLHVVRSFKGDLRRERLTLVTGPHSAACGYPFEVGQSYLVYAHAREGALRTDLCTRTRAMAEAAEDVQALGMGATPVDPTGPGATAPPIARDEPARGGCAGCAATGTAASGAWPLLLTLAALRRRRRRR